MAVVEEGAPCVALLGSGARRGGRGGRGERPGARRMEEDVTGAPAPSSEVRFSWRRRVRRRARGGGKGGEKSRVRVSLRAARFKEKGERGGGRGGGMAVASAMLLHAGKAVALLVRTKTTTDVGRPRRESQEVTSLGPFRIGAHLLFFYFSFYRVFLLMSFLVFVF